jgi:TRAP transporter TAXI family solute receptor
MIGQKRNLQQSGRSVMHGRLTRASIRTAAAALAILAAAGAHAQDIKLPPTLTVTAYDTGTAGFNIAVAIGKALKDKYGTDVRVLPAGNDVARLAPLRAGRAQISAMGIGTFFAGEGVFEFAAKDWGPQPVRMTLGTLDCNGISLGVAADTGLKEAKDLRGKRIGFVVGSPALNQNSLAVMAYAGLTKNDVKVVEFASYGAMWKGIVNNDVDAAVATTITGPAREVESSPRGLVWVPMPAGDKEAWARVNAIAPYLQPHNTTCGAGGISPSKPLPLGNYPYPAFTVYNTADPDLVYAIARAMIATYPDYKDTVPGAIGFAPDKQLKRWVIPFHAAAVKALTDAGQWTPADEAHNNKLVKRQEVMQAAWTDFLKSNPPSDDAKFRAGWMAARRDALTKASLEIGVDEAPTQ